MADPNFVKDGKVIWLEVPKVGTPPVWTAGVNYSIGDAVVPSDPPIEKENVMFQAVGFVGTSGSVYPTFPTTEGQTFIDGNIKWKTKKLGSSPSELFQDEYFYIKKTVTVT